MHEILRLLAEAKVEFVCGEKRIDESDTLYAKFMLEDQLDRFLALLDEVGMLLLTGPAGKGFILTGKPQDRDDPAFPLSAWVADGTLHARLYDFQVVISTGSPSTDGAIEIFDPSPDPHGRLDLVVGSVPAPVV